MNGDLAVCRAFGDVVGFKGEDSKGTEVGKMRGLTSRPIVKKYFLKSEDEFLILGCDGKYFTFSNICKL